ncbi:MAG: AAA family ATPase [Caldilineaceae bacterium]
MFDFSPAYLRNEKEVESKLIVQYLLPALGYRETDWHQEVALGSIRLDFLAFAAQMLPFTLSAPAPFCLVIEAKSPKRKLDTHVYRLRQYLTMLQTDYGLLTNGHELRIYRRIGDTIQMIFQCAGPEIAYRMDEIKALIGRDVLQMQKHTKTKIVDPYPTGGKQKSVKIIAIYHNKGGVGKTTISVNLAAALRKRRYRVLLIDLDSQANSTFAAGLVKFQFDEDDDLRDNNVFHVLESGEFNFVQDVVRQSNLFNNPEIDVVPSHISLIEGQYKLNQIKASQTRLIKKLKQEEANYDFVIIDTPPSRDIYAQVAIIAANYLIIPSDLKPFANQGLFSVRNFIKEINEFRDSMGRPSIKVMGVLPSKISTNKKAFDKTFARQKEKIISQYEFPVMDSIIFERAALSHAINQIRAIGDLEVPDPKSIFDFADQTTGANQSAAEFDSLATEVLRKVEKL